MGNTVSNWVNNKIIKTTYDPVADSLKSLYRSNIQENISSVRDTFSYLGGGLGSAILTIPGVGKATIDAWTALTKESEDLLNKAEDMTPDDIAAANDALKIKIANLEAQAIKEGKTYEPDDNEFKIKRFISKVIHNTLYLSIAIIIIVLAFIGSSLAANRVFIRNNNISMWHILYYMFYGFILFPVPLGMGLKQYYVDKEPLFKAVWAPLFKGYSSNIFLNILRYPFIYTSISETVQYEVSQPISLEQVKPMNPILFTNNSRASFEPTRV